jgi:hypothetical protein
VLVIDLIVGGLIVVMVAWGFWRGLTISTLALAGFAAGAVLGARLAPLVLNGGLSSTYAPVIAVPGALVAGAVSAAAVERFGFRLRHRLDRLGPAGPIGGALLGGCLGVMAAWILGTVALQVDSLRDQVRRSEILSRLDAVLQPPGPTPVLEASFDPFPTVEGPPPQVAPIDPRVVSEPGVRAASHSVVKVLTMGCHHGGSGSGWIAAEGLVVTNAHVLATKDVIEVRFQERGPSFPATAIWFDPRNDVGILRVPGVKGVPALPLVHDPHPGTPAAVLGFPLGHWKVGPARLGPTSSTTAGHLSKVPKGISSKLFGRLITSFAGRTQHGNSGGPVVDARGRVLATVFGGDSGGFYGFGVSNTVVRAALQRAGPPVGTGPCSMAGTSAA